VRKDRDSRKPQRRGLDDDNDSPSRDFGSAPRESGPRSEASPAGPTVQATVKWYNPDKEFGFVVLASGGDAFLHVSVVERSGSSTVPPGATLEVRVGPGQKGGVQVTEILSVDSSTAQQEPARRPRPERPHALPDQATVEEFGTVKFYAAEKGFGFIVRDRGGKDIFVHASALNRAGISELAEGQRVAVDMVEGGKGPEAVSIRLI
jgi:CspA family cold shock protein